jgi:hypothetical protein
MLRAASIHVDSCGRIGLGETPQDAPASTRIATQRASSVQGSKEADSSSSLAHQPPAESEVYTGCGLGQNQL